MLVSFAVAAQKLKGDGQVGTSRITVDFNAQNMNPFHANVQKRRVFHAQLTGNLSREVSQVTALLIYLSIPTQQARRLNRVKFCYYELLSRAMSAGLEG